MLNCEVYGKTLLKQIPNVVREWARNQEINPTPAELELKRIFIKNGIRHRSHVAEITSHYCYILDFTIVTADLKICIEVDGGYHNIKKIKERDLLRDLDLKSIGYTTIRITNAQVMMGAGELLQILKELGVPFTRIIAV